MNVSNGGRGSQEYNQFQQENSCRVQYLFSYWLEAGRNERGGLLSWEVPVAHAVSAFQTKLSTASSVNAQIFVTDCVIGWIIYRII